MPQQHHPPCLHDPEGLYGVISGQRADSGAWFMVEPELRPHLSWVRYRRRHQTADITDDDAPLAGGFYRTRERRRALRHAKQHCG